MKPNISLQIPNFRWWAGIQIPHLSRAAVTIPRVSRPIRRSQTTKAVRATITSPNPVPTLAQSHSHPNPSQPLPRAAAAAALAPPRGRLQPAARRRRL
ncbi:hypothetical protein DAI22_05g090400 [Oryza sativa Japonica Group]|nr:hypothetical protein DAI22_05g090400 [Oryza sativa Japonica Group]